MFDQQPDPNNLPTGMPRHLPAVQPANLRAVGYSPLDLPRYDNSADLTLRGLLKVVRKRIWLIVGIVAIVTTLVTIETFRTRPLYQATATIEVGPNESGTRVGSSEVFIQRDDPLLVTMNTSEVILKSAPLLEDVVAQLRLDQTPEFFQVSAKKSLLESLSEISGQIQSDGKAAAPAVFTTTPVTSNNAESRSPEEGERLARFVGMLERSLAIRPIRDTRAMNISYTHTDPVLAASIANAIATRFVARSFEKKVEGFTSASEWLDRSTRELKTKVERAEQALADYTRANNIYSVDGKETLITGKLVRLHDQATRAETERILKQSLYEQVIQGRLAQIPEAFADPQTVELKKKLADLEIVAAELSVSYGPKYLKVVEINEQMSAIREQMVTSRNLLDGKLRADFERAVRDEEALNAALAMAKGEASKESQNAIQYSLLKQDVDTSKSVYTEFLQKTNQADLQVAQQHSNIRLISPARTPKRPVSPNRQRNILIGLLLSLVGGIGLASLLERLDDSIRNTDDVNRFTQLPTLAVIPAIRAGNARLIATKASGILTESISPVSAEKPSVEMRRARLMEFDGRSPVAEAYRALRTGLLLSAPGRPPKTILVTSVRMGDGKTTTATNIAISLAQLGASVVVMDCDLRKPSIHGVFGIPQGPGLSTYLTRKGNLDEITRGGAADQLAGENLNLIPAGPTPPNPSELLSSEGMKRLLEQLSDRYDHVVLDSPPLGSVTDPVVLSTLADGVILVVHGGRNSRQAVQRGCQELLSVGAKIFGIVLNNVDLRREGYDDYHYYSYGYPKNGNGKNA
jgi:polysaccharide biosynthesis transport protein